MSSFKGEDWAIIGLAAFAAYIVYDLVVKPGEAIECEIAASYNDLKTTLNSWCPSNWL